MRYLFILFMLIAAQSNAQRYRLDSFGHQNGYPIYYPHAIMRNGPISLNIFFYASTNGFINQNGDTESYAIMKLDTGGKLTILDSGDHNMAFPLQLRHTSQWVGHTGKLYYNKLDHQNSPGFYRCEWENGTITKLNAPPNSSFYNITNGVPRNYSLQNIAFENGTWFLKTYSVSNNTYNSVPLYGYTNVTQNYGGELIAEDTNGHIDFLYYNSYLETIKIKPRYNNGQRNPFTKVHRLTGSFIVASDSAHGSELWTMGNEWDSVFTRLTDLAPGKADGAATVAVAGAGIYFCSPADTATGSFTLYGYRNNKVEKIYTFYYDKNSPIAAEPYCKNFAGYYNDLYFSAPNGKDRVLWKLKGYPYWDTMPKIVSLPGIASIINPESITIWWFYGKGTSLVFTGENDGITKLYRLTDSSVVNEIRTISPGISASLYPNPTTHDAHLDIQLKDAQTVQVSVTDIQGRIVYGNKAQLYSAGKHTVNLPTGTLPGGLYIYNINDERGMLLQSGKLVKE